MRWGAVQDMMVEVLPTPTSTSLSRSSQLEEFYFVVSDSLSALVNTKARSCADGGLIRRVCVAYKGLKVWRNRERRSWDGAAGSFGVAQVVLGVSTEGRGGSRICGGGWGGEVRRGHSEIS